MSRKTSDWRRWWLAEAADGAGRDADHRARLAAPDALAVGTRADVDGVLQHAGDGAVVLWSDEEDGVRRSDLVAEGDPGGGRLALVVEILVVEGKMANLDDLEAQHFRGQGDKGIGRLAVEGALAQAADDHGDVVDTCHGCLLSLWL
jgi:hypothetical protein